MEKCICGKEFKNKIALGAHHASCKLFQEEKQQKLKILKLEEQNYEYVCNCGKRYKTLTSLNSHARFCNQYIKKVKQSKYFNSNTSTYICECGYETNNAQSLNAHFTHCEQHRQTNGKDCSQEYWNKRNHIGKMQGWDKFTNDEIHYYRDIKAGKTYSVNQKLGIIKNAWIGRKETDEHRLHIREGQLKRIAEICNLNGDIKRLYPTFSTKGCEYMNKLNEEKHWHLQHALNNEDGEFYIDGYWLDGYDKELNIVFEYDESHHYTDVYNNILTERDLYRQNYIIEKLHCEFWRYNEKMKLLYRVN